jgi:hypothetical protein
MEESLESSTVALERAQEEVEQVAYRWQWACAFWGRTRGAFFNGEDCVLQR